MRPLDDIRIIAIEQYGAGPYGSLHLADLGADVIKIEDPSHGGDVGRYVPPFQEQEDSLFFETFNRNKRSLSLDLRSEPGRRVFHDLVRTADAVYSNLRGDVPAALGITYDDLAHVNPRIVCVSLSGFGATGPRRSQPGYDYILQGLTGWMSVTGEPDGAPVKTGLSLVDFSGGLVGALTLLAAVHGARRSGQGMDCDLSLYDVATSMLSYEATWHLNADWTPGRVSRSAHPSLVPFQLFAGRDARWFVVACAKEKFWHRLAKAIDRSELADDPRFESFAARYRHRRELIEILDGVFDGEPASHWIRTLEAAGVPVGAVHSIAEALQDEHTAARGLIIDIPHDRFGTVRQVRSPARVGDQPTELRRAPHRNEHAAEIFSELQYSDADVAELAAAGAFG
ncbi:MAG TPA: CoA transferase [Acidimicrobiia bacterium]|nr:CoA transferase [Acidimicrobiia bacterium]